jgi:hypothetical protein
MTNGKIASFEICLGIGVGFEDISMYFCGSIKAAWKCEGQH